MKRYPHTPPWSPALGFAAAAATVATMAVAIVLPAAISVQPNAEVTTIATRDAKPAVVLHRIEVVASRSVAAVDKPTAIPAALVTTKQRG